jgi:hypothetical protein
VVNKKAWEEFRDSGLLWWINMVLHTFGWSIVIKVESNKVLEVYPARVKFRGFDEQSNTDGYIKVSEFMKNNAEDILKESKE